MTARETRHLTLADGIALHHFVMRHLGHAPVRDEAALESAITRPRMAEYYEGADIITQCALLGVGTSQAQAFIDGNKRTPFAAMRLYRSQPTCDFGGSDGYARQLEAVAESSGKLVDATERFEAWLRERAAPL